MPILYIRQVLVQQVSTVRTLGTRAAGVYCTYARYSCSRCLSSSSVRSRCSSSSVGKSSTIDLTSSDSLARSSADFTREPLDDVDEPAQTPLDDVDETTLKANYTGGSAYTNDMGMQYNATKCLFATLI